MKLDGDKIRRARERLGYSIELTGAEADISKNSVLRAEHEEDIRPSTARRLARALQVEVADLIKEADVPKAQAPLWHEDSQTKASAKRRGAHFEQLSPEEARRLQAQLEALGDVQSLVQEMYDRLASLGEVAEHGTEEEQQEAKARLLRVAEDLGFAA